MARKKETVESLRKKIKEMKGSLTYEQEDRPRMYHHREDIRKIADEIKTRQQPRLVKGRR